MKPGRESQTAVMVCMARAAAHGRLETARFADPTALMLLPDDARSRVERFRAGAKPKSFREAMARASLDKRAKMMVARTVAIDDAVREVANVKQVVILGAGLDGRAWRMSEWRDAVVFEVDHPDSQRQKRARAAALPKAAGDIRFVPVDFTRDDLEQALAAAGHDASKPTVWIWEGVVMYLTLAEIEKTLSVVAGRSAKGSRLIVAYLSPAPLLAIVGLVVRRVGEPLRSVFKAAEMRGLLSRYGFAVARDESLTEIGNKLSDEVARAMRPMRHLRIVVADR